MGFGTSDVVTLNTTNSGILTEKAKASHEINSVRAGPGSNVPGTLVFGRSAPLRSLEHAEALFIVALPVGAFDFHPSL